MAAVGRWLFTFVFVLSCLPAMAAPPSPPEVRTQQGRIAGTDEGNVRVFRGVPYALPPVGERRWRSPAPAAAWRGLRDASAFGPGCEQPPYPADSVYFEPPRVMSEDCLTLNVWAPGDAQSAPVIVWIHGGALLRGGSASPMYDGGAFARRGVVFVSINYRLGVLGWLAHPALSAESASGVSGNYGLLDQIAALRWVRGNAAAFGGDAGNVTVMGESAGALSISYLLASPQARGLFDKAIVQSPNIRAVPRLREPAFGLPSAEEIGTTLADTMGAKDIVALRAMSAEALTIGALRARFIAQPTVDGSVLRGQVVEIFDRGEQAKVPLLAGFNGGEILTQRALAPSPPPGAAEYVSEIVKRYGDLAPAFLKLYPASDMQGSLLAAARDAVFGWATERMVRQQDEAGQPAYLYLFDHCDAAARARSLCAFHASELPYVFDRTGNADQVPPNWPVPAGSGESELAKLMIGYWTRFAATGSPNLAGAPTWSRYGSHENYMHFMDGAVAGTGPVPGMFELQEQIAARRRCHGEQWFTNIGPAAGAALMPCP